MSSIRAAQGKENGFVMLSNVCARDRRLSGLARGIVYIILSHPTDWVFTIDWLMGEMTEGRKAISNALNELQQFGYLRRDRKFLGRGKFEWNQIISDEPLPAVDGELSTTKPKPQVDSSGQSSHDESSHDELSHDDNRTHETTCGNTLFPQVVSSAPSSHDENSADIHKTELPNTVAEDELAGAAGPPEFALPLIRLMQANGLGGIPWSLKSGEWLIVHALIKAKGIEAMTDYAIRTCARKNVSYARYFIPGWKELVNQAPDGSVQPDLRAVGPPPPLTRRQQEQEELQAKRERQMARARARSAGA